MTDSFAITQIALIRKSAGLLNFQSLLALRRPDAPGSCLRLGRDQWFLVFSEYVQNHSSLKRTKIGEGVVRGLVPYPADLDERRGDLCPPWPKWMRETQRGEQAKEGEARLGHLKFVRWRNLGDAKLNLYVFPR